MMKFRNKVSIMAICVALTLSATSIYAEERGTVLAGEEFTAEEYIKDALDAANRGVEVIFPYSIGNVYQIYLQQGYVTDIQLPPGESLKYVGAGDTTRWLIDTNTTGDPGNKITHIFVKPIQRGINTNLIINTDKRVYQLLLVSGNSFNPIVSWNIPKSKSQLKAESLVRTYGTINPDKMNFRYKIDNRKYDWSPELVFNSEDKTYLKMKSAISNTELPAFFVIDDSGKLVLVSYRFVKGYMVIDRLFDKAVLIQGKKKVKISKKG